MTGGNPGKGRQGDVPSWLACGHPVGGTGRQTLVWSTHGPLQAAASGFPEDRSSYTAPHPRTPQGFGATCAADGEAAADGTSDAAVGILAAAAGDEPP